MLKFDMARGTLRVKDIFTIEEVQEAYDDIVEYNDVADSDYLYEISQELLKILNDYADYDYFRSESEFFTPENAMLFLGVEEEVWDSVFGYIDIEKLYRDMENLSNNVELMGNYYYFN